MHERIPPSEKRKERLKMILALLVGARLARLREEIREKITEKLISLEEAEEEVKQVSPPKHGTKLGTIETAKLLEHEKCPEDFEELVANADKHIPKDQYEDFEIAFKNFVFGLEAKKRKELAQ